MSYWIEYDNYLRIPYSVANAKYHVKEELQLNSFQSFLLDAVESNATISQICEATLLPKFVITEELEQMADQGIVKESNVGYSLTELAERILTVTRVVEQLNHRYSKIFINLATLQIEESVNALDSSPGTSNLSFLHAVPKHVFDGIELSDNAEFLHSVMSDIEKKDSSIIVREEDFESCLEYIYLEVVDSDVNPEVFAKQHINRLPCLISTNQSNPPKPFSSLTNHIAEGIMYEIEFRISKEQEKKYPQFVNTPLRCWFDSVSGFSSISEPMYESLQKKRSNLLLPELWRIDGEVEAELAKTLIIEKELPSDIELITASTTKMPYYVRFTTEWLTEE